MKLSQWYLERKDKDFNTKTAIQDNGSENIELALDMINKMIQGT